MQETHLTKTQPHFMVKKKKKKKKTHTPQSRNGREVPHENKGQGCRTQGQEQGRPTSASAVLSLWPG